MKLSNILSKSEGYCKLKKNKALEGTVFFNVQTNNRTKYISVCY